MLVRIYEYRVVHMPDGSFQLSEVSHDGWGNIQSIEPALFAGDTPARISEQLKNARKDIKNSFIRHDATFLPRPGKPLDEKPGIR